MRDKDAFKRGFLQKLAEHGVLPSDVTAAMTKRANLLNWMKGLGGVALSGTKAGLTFGLGIPLLAGTTVGAAARAAARADDEDVEELKRQEMIAEYRRLAKEVRDRTQRGY